MGAYRRGKPKALCYKLYMLYSTSGLQQTAFCWERPGPRTWTKTDSLVFSLQANCTDWATATIQQILVPTFVDRGVLHGQCGRLLTVVNLSFLDWSCYFFSQVAPHLSSQGWVDPVPDPLLLRNSGSTGNRAWDLWICSQELWPLDHRGGTRTWTLYKILIWTAVSGKSVSFISRKTWAAGFPKTSVTPLPVYVV
jgi:hypothetical protein